MWSKLFHCCRKWWGVRYIHCPVCGTRMTDEEISAGMKWAMDGGTEDGLNA
ncbi:MAG: hypothetical protein IKK34_07000 [Clostridia bacterium]|nr:hypothetical protein [Clostridia bacterium]